MGLIDRATVDRIYAAADIVEIIGDYVTLKRKGELSGVLSLPQRKDSLVRRIAFERRFQMLRLRQGGQRRYLRHSVRYHSSPRGCRQYAPHNGLFPLRVHRLGRSL